jgi:cholesterol 7-desaturase
MLYNYYHRGFDKKGSESRVLQYYMLCGTAQICFPQAWATIHEWAGSDLTNPLLSPSLWSFLSMFLFCFVSMKRLQFYLVLLFSVYGVSMMFPHQESFQPFPGLYYSVVQFLEIDHIFKVICSLIVGIFLIALLAECGLLLFSVSSDPNTDAEIRNPKNCKRSRSARAKNFPPAYPNGWFKLLNSDELEVGQSKFVRACGHDFAVYRGENGKAVVLDAYCPHLGANIADGVVRGNCLECPFHGWRFDEQGKCVDVPYAKGGSLPANANTRSWPSMEFGKMICVFVDAEGHPPEYQPILLPEIDQQLLKPIGGWSQVVDMHIQDFAENAADYAHFNYVHDNLGLPLGLDPLFYLTHDITWHPGVPGDESKTQFSYFIDNVQVYCKWFPNYPFPQVVKSVVIFNGPGSIVYFRFNVKYLGDILLIKTFLPVDDLQVLVQDRYFANSRIPGVLARFICGQALHAFVDDIKIWSRKSYSFKPAILRDDGPMAKVRRWYSQFYPKDQAKARKPASETDW